jgi:hypothetical protein
MDFGDRRRTAGRLTEEVLQIQNILLQKKNVRLPVFRDRSELVDCVLRAFTLLGVHEAMIDMIVDESALGACDSIFYRQQLLHDFNAGPLIFDHPNNTAQVAGRPV